ncbi:MAG: hypothetical protein QMD80_02925 [archaeon]|nr:hypothetical protein [archaeon]
MQDTRYRMKGAERRLQTYKDLEIYQLSHKLAIDIHRGSLGLPKFELYEEIG